jgi:diguanylate cyclase (GGDEF)-like protein
MLVKVVWTRDRGLKGASKGPSPQNTPSKEAPPSVERRLTKRRKVSRKLLVISVVGMVVSVLAYTANTVEIFAAMPFLRAALYGLMLAFTALAFVVVVFSLRKWEELSQDTNGRARAEEALSESEARFIAIEHRIRDMTMLSEMAQMLDAARTSDEAYAVIVQSMQDLFPHESGALCLLSASRSVVEAVAIWGESPSSERVFSPDDCWALRRGQMHVVLDAHSGTPCRHVHHHARAGGYLCMPMMVQSETLGILHLQMAPRLKQPLAVAVAGQIGLALGNLKLREALRIQAIRDPLTGLFNRRYMEESLERELRRAIRNQRPLGIIMLDLDHFKQLNDRAGHEAGDTILRELGNCIQMVTREYDLACRYGGEEFTIILPDAALNVTVKRAEKLRDKFKHLHTQHQNRRLPGGTLSLGVAGFPEHGSTTEAVLRAADTALYQAKHEGRDRVVVAEALG